MKRIIGFIPVVILFVCLVVISQTQTGYMKLHPYVVSTGTGTAVAMPRVGLQFEIINAATNYVAGADGVTARWTDTSSNTLHAVQATHALKGIASGSAVAFTGVRRLVSPTIASKLPGDVTVAFKFTPGSLTASHHVVSGNSYSPMTLTTTSYVTYRGAYGTYPTATVSINVTHVVCMLLPKGTKTGSKLFVDGAEFGEMNQSPGAGAWSGGVIVGADYTGSNNLEGDVYGVRI